jgi:uncharacterized protein YbjT (DUF2867 family)
MCLMHAAAPPFVVNVTGSAALRVRDLAARLGALLGREPVVTGSEAPDALLARTARGDALFGPPETALDDMLAWTAAWVRAGGELLGRPTKFEQRAGVF